MALIVERWPEAEANFRYNMVGGATPAANSHSVGVGLFGADGYGTVDLGGSRRLVGVGDTFWATAAGKTRGQCRFLRNTVGILQGDNPETMDVEWFCGGDPVSHPLPWLNVHAVDGIPYSRGWGGGLKIASDLLLLWGGLVRSSNTFPFFSLHGIWFSLFSDLAGDPTTWTEIKLKSPINTDIQPSSVGVGGGPFLDDSGDYLMFALELFGGWGMARLPLERALAGDLSEWAYADGAGGWERDMPDRWGGNIHQSRINFFGTGHPLHRIDGNWQVCGGGLLDPHVDTDVQDNPLGPWQKGDALNGLTYVPSERTEFYRPPPFNALSPAVNQCSSVLSGKKYLYGPHVMQGMRWDGNNVFEDAVVLYSTNNSNHGTSVFSDARYYWPEVLRVTEYFLIP